MENHCVTEEETAVKEMDLAQLDTLLEFLDQEHPFYMQQWMKNLKNSTFQELSFLRIVLAVPHQETVDDLTLKQFAGLASQVGCIISTFDLKKMHRYDEMARKLYEQLKVHLEPLRRWTHPTPQITDKETAVKEMDLALFDALLAFLDQEYSTPVTTSLITNLKDSACLLDLLYLRTVLKGPEAQLITNFTLKKSACLASKLGSISSAFDLKKMDGKMVQRLYKLLVVLLQPMKCWERPPNINVPLRIFYPNTDRLGFANHLVENILGQQVKSGKLDSIIPLKGFLVRLQRMLQTLNSLLMETSQPQHKQEDLDIQDLYASITNLAFEVEYIIDSYLVKRITTLSCICWLRDALIELEYCESLVKMESGKVNSIARNVINMCRRDELKIIPTVTKTGIAKDSIIREITTESGNVESVVREIINMSRRNELSIIPFVTDTEIAKDSEIREIISDGAIIHMYPFITSIQISCYKERKREVFLDLIWRIFKNMDDNGKNAIRRELRERKQSQIEITLGRLLCSHKVLIILEDVSDIDAINDITRLFGDTHYGSTILVTTASRELAIQCCYGSQRILFNCNLTSQTNNDIVGFKTEVEELLEFLIGGQTQLRLISIIGMAGQGKTTLAMKLYNDISIVQYFDTRTWCCVSQSYEKRELLLELLGHVLQLSDTIRQKNDGELAEMLYKHLKGRRFLIFLDDMWEINAWNDLARCFPNDNNGSRIIFTTRIQGLASQATSSSKLQSLSLLSDDECWELLKKKLFKNDSCPPQLLEIGRRIAKNCKGLPLSVILIAGVLSKMEKKMDQWEQTADSLSLEKLGNVEAESKCIIELSYKNLPDHLKPCFLYFGAFLDDKEVPVQKLIQIWIAEGFIRCTTQNSLEDIAEGYLMDLINRCLITTAQEKSKGGTKSCRVHDLLREFCLIKAREENFLQEIRGYDKHFPPSNDILDYGLDPNCSCSSTPKEYCLRRLCILSKRNHFIMLKPYGSSVRSLLFFAASDLCPNYSYDVSFIPRNFKILRILDLGNINIGDSLESICVLFHLRYLAVEGNFDFIPSSIANLWNLQTFLVKELAAKVIKVPDSIWDIANLRHMHINGATSFDLDSQRLENSSTLDNLKTFSTPSLAYGDDTERMMRKLRSIRKLKCIFLDHWYDDANYFPRLEFLSQLESLNVFYNGDGKYPCKFGLPSNLKKLTLSNFRMPWSEISQFAILCNLEVLKLVNNAFEGERWEMTDEVFTRLKFLKLNTLDVVEWSAEGDHFPRLERLLLHKCERLDTIPASLGGLPSLQMIELKWCNPSVAISAKEIQEEQLEYGNELKVYVYSEV